MANKEGRNESDRKGLIAQSFLTSLPIVLTVGLGFIANYWQSRHQHEEQLKIAGLQAERDREKQAFSSAEAERGRRAEAEARLEQQAREFSANAQMAESRFGQEQATLRLQHEAQRGQQAREFAQSLERQRRENEGSLLLEVIKVGDLEVARSNIQFLIEAGLVRDAEGSIERAVRQRPPVLPTATGALTEAVGFEDTGPLPSPSASNPRAGTRRANRLLQCAIDEFNKNVREDGGAGQIQEYLQALRLRPDASLPWSGAFVAFCLQSIGATSQITPSAAIQVMMAAAQRSGIWIPAAGATPVPGDIYFISRSSGFGMHIGIIHGVDGQGGFQGLEGNLRNRISLVRRSLATPRLEGFARLRD